MKYNSISYFLKSSSFNQLTLILYIKFLKTVLNRLNINHSIVVLPKKKKRITLLKSPHVNKKAREQFQMNKFSFLVKFKLNKKDNIVKLLNLNKPKIVENYIKLKLQ